MPILGNILTTARVRQGSESNQFSPLLLSPSLWIDATEITSKNDGDSIAASDILDKSGNERNPSVGGTILYKTNIVNEKPALYFNGSDSVLTGDYPVSNFEETRFIVFKVNSHVNYTRLFVTVSDLDNSRSTALGSSSGVIISAGKTTVQGGINYNISEPQIIVSSFNSESDINTSIFDKYEIGNGDALIQGNVPNQKYSIGARQDQSFLNGYISEVICFPRVLTQSENDQMKTYLELKYSILNLNKSILTEAVKYAGNPLLANNDTFGSVVFVNNAYKLAYTKNFAANYTGGNIYLAESNDGKNFSDIASNPIINLGANGEWDDTHVAVSYMFYYNNKYYIFYRGTDDISADRKVGIASSADGITFVKNANNPILYASDAWEYKGIEVWGVLKVGSIWHIYFSDFGTAASVFPRNIGVATTTEEPDNWSFNSFTKSNLNPLFKNYNRCMDIFVYNGYYYAITTYRSIATKSSFNVYKASNPLFTDAEYILEIISNSNDSGVSWDSYFIDTPNIITTDVNRNSFPAGNIKIYYSADKASDNWNMGLLEVSLADLIKYL